MLRLVTPAYVARFLDNTQLPMHAKPNAMRYRWSTDFAGARDAVEYVRCIQHMQRLYDMETPHFIDRNLDSQLSMLRLQIVEVAATAHVQLIEPRDHVVLHRQPITASMQLSVVVYFEAIPHCTYGMFAVISAMLLVHGVSYPVGAMHIVSQVTTDAVRQQGVAIHLIATVRVV